MEEIKSFMASAARKLAIKANANRINEIMLQIDTEAKNGGSFITLENTPMAVLQFLEANHFKVDITSIITNSIGIKLINTCKVSW